LAEDKLFADGEDEGVHDWGDFGFVAGKCN